ncbi:MAG: ABC transporter permease [Kiritimatiellae bacterium]|nr:ABC transporter permease [Kiritimatiellia bacterium]
MKALIETNGLKRDFQMGRIPVQALRGIDLSIRQGEFVAIMGPSGSGKSTIMYILGCLDHPTSGTYTLDGMEVSRLEGYELARVRNREIGFVFQQYNLLSDLDVLGNIGLGLVYGGMDISRRREISRRMAEQLGLADRLHHRPTELSGGQMQRVAIARALAGKPHLILADEPTGNLDSKTGQEIMELLARLNREGHTIVVVTHDPNVAKYASRVISVSDGLIVADEATARADRAAPADGTRPARPEVGPPPARPKTGGKSRVHLYDVLRMAFREGITAHKLRSLLTMLGIVFGIAAVIAMTAITEGGKQQQLDQIRQIGMNNIQVRDLGLEGARLLRVRRVNPDGITLDDAAMIREYVPGIEAWTAWKAMKAELKLRDKVVDDAHTLGIAGDFQSVANFYVAHGRFLSERDADQFHRVCVLGSKVAEKLGLGEAAVGTTLILGDEPFRVVGVMGDKEYTKSEITDVNIVDRNMDVYIPYSSLRTYFRKDARASHLDAVSLRMTSDEWLLDQSKAIQRIVADLHNEAEDFAVSVPLEQLRQAQKTKEVFNIIIIVIAAISLVVGGIGIMNIMIANVTERTREIGVRCAVGASRRDILKQFLTEAVLISLLGGSIGLLTGLLGGSAIEAVFGFPVAFRPFIMFLSVFISTGVGIAFGIYPAWLAANMNPVDALRT